VLKSPIYKLGSWVCLPTPGGDIAGVGRIEETHDAREKENAARKVEATKKENMVAPVVEEGISMVMKQRAVKGYGIGWVSVSLACQSEK